MKVNWSNTAGSAPFRVLTVTGRPSVKISAAPRTMLSIPSVAISEGNRP